MRSRASVIILIVLLAIAAGGCGRQNDSKVIARVNGQPITQQQLWDYLELIEDGATARGALDGLVVRHLIRQEAEKRDISVDRAEIDRRLAGVADYLLANTGNSYEQWLEESGQTEQDVARLAMARTLSKFLEEEATGLSPFDSLSTLGPDGVLAFTSDRDGKREVYQMDRSGEVQQITHTPGGMTGSWLSTSE